MSLGYGFKARIGQLYPSGGQCDYEPQLMAPEGVQFLTTRMPFKASRLEDDLKLANEVESHASLCADAAVDLILFNCTAASMVAGPKNINDRVLKATGIRSTTTIEAVLDAMAATGMKHVALVTAYHQEVVDEEIRYLEERGYKVVSSGGIPCENPIQQGSIPPSTWVQTIKSLDLNGADGMLISCAGIQIGSVVQQIEDHVGIPVVTSNQAAVWKCLKLLDIADRPQGYGDLLAGRFG